MALAAQHRPAAGDPQGLLVLHHGRGSDDRDLLGLADALDPERRLHVVTPRAPLQLPGAPGFHWYVVPRVGHPDPATFEAGRTALADFHDGLLAETGLAANRLVLGGFSQGAVMSWTLAASAERPAPGGVLALSGFVPVVDGWTPALRAPTRAFVAHGRQDPVIAFGFGEDARDQALAAGLPTDWHPFDGAHHVDPAQLPAMREWLAVALPA